MKPIKRNIFLLLGSLTLLLGCTELEKDIYSVVPEDNFWSTPEEVASGIAPGYQALTALPSNDLFAVNEVTSDELLIPTRGGDWYDGGIWQELWKHTWTPSHTVIDQVWKDLYNGIGRINFAMNSVNNLETQPDNVENVIAELKVLRAYYYYWLLDLFGNVPIVVDFNTNPNEIANVERKEVFSFLENELEENIGLLEDAVDNTTYGRVNKWVGLAILAKLYMNAQVYIGEEKWPEANSVLDQIINSGNYSLSPGYYDNFSPDNGPESPENIFVVPFDKVNISGNSFSFLTLHHNSNENFDQPTLQTNGRSAGPEFYEIFDTTSVYRADGNRAYRTFLDQRTGQWLVGQQYRIQYSYPPDKDVIVKAEDELKMKDGGTGLDLFLTPKIDVLSSPNAEQRLVGARSLKYFPDPGAPLGQAGNDMVLFRYADILLMKAEAKVRMGEIDDEALTYVNTVIERAYSGDQSKKLALGQLTLDNLLDERGRELAWEMWRRQDLIRYEIASGKPYFTASRIPEKSEDGSQNTLLFPIPNNQISSNPKLQQNPGY